MNQVSAEMIRRMRQVVSVMIIALALLWQPQAIAEEATEVAASAETSAQETRPATIVVWAERRAEDEAYPLRLLLSEKVLRFDGGKDTDDYLLLERDSKTLFNVVRADQMVLRVPYVVVAVDEKLAKAIRLEEVLEPMQGAPKVEGLVPMKLTLKADGEVCRTSVVVPDLFPEILAALKEFATAMASFHAANLPSAAAENVNACSFADAILAPTRSLESGFPIQENQSAGLQRMLFSLEEDVALPAALFAPPADYSVETFSVTR